MAAFADKIGVKVHTSIENVGKGFDAVYSCHVLEHTPNPRKVILDQLSLVKPGGIVIGHTPNGSKHFSISERTSFIGRGDKCLRRNSSKVSLDKGPTLRPRMIAPKSCNGIIKLR
jgi:2-polyprenyl-3-methyl-5-hydroxy-6-metoxy-1,4-benzoquinol methylase